MISLDEDIRDKEEELIEKIAQKIIDSDLDPIAIMFLNTIKPISNITGELGYFFLAPYLPILDEKGYDFIDTFEKRENIERIIKRVERLSKEKAREERKNRGPDLWSRLKGIFISGEKTL